MHSNRSESDRVGAILAGQFRVERLLGEGGMGSVYLAEQLGVGRKVVVKLMKGDIPASQRATMEDRFQREARLVAQLNHPNLVHLHTFGGCESGELYLAMEYIAGRSLRQVLQAEGALSAARVLAIVDQICGALHEAHVTGIVHRDLKPDNVMLTQRRETPDFVKVLDFGVAKLLRHEGTMPQKSLTATGAVFGTPQYMAPERVYARPVDARTDVYALGLIAYELLTGAPVFEADSAIEIMMKHTSAPVTPLSQRRIGLQLRRGTEVLVTRALEKEPARRFTDMPEMQAAVRAALRELEPEGPSAMQPVPSPRHHGKPTLEQTNPELVHTHATPDHNRRPGTSRPAPRPRQGTHPEVVAYTNPPARPTNPPVGGTIPPQASVLSRLMQSLHPVHVIFIGLFVGMVSLGVYHSWSATPEPTAEAVVMASQPREPARDPFDKERLRERYDGYVENCLNFAPIDFSTRWMYLGSVPSAEGPAPGKKTYMRETTDPQFCDKALAELTRLGPEMAVDRSARRYATALRALHDVSIPAYRYCEHGDYQDDAMARGRELHRALLAAFDELAEAHTALRLDLEFLEAQLRPYYEARATPDEALQLQGDTAAKIIVRLGNIDWRKMNEVNLPGLRKAIQTYEDVLERQAQPHPGNVALLGAAKAFARQVEKPSWNAAERSRVREGMAEQGSPADVVLHFNGAMSLFRKLPVMSVIPLPWRLPSMQE